MRRLILGGLVLSLLWPLAGCTTVASMVVKHVAMSQGKKVAKKVYHDLKGDNKKAAPAGAERAVAVASVPAGAKIEVNGRPVGAAPVTVVVKLGPGGRVAREYRIRAKAAGPGQHDQEYRLLHYPGEPGDRAPAGVTFHMTKPPPGAVKVSW